MQAAKLLTSYGNFCNSRYALYLSRVMERVKEHTQVREAVRV